MSGTSSYFSPKAFCLKQTIFLISDISLFQNDQSRNIQVFLVFQNQQIKEIPLLIANFPYLAMAKLQIPATQNFSSLPSIKIIINQPKEKEILIPPQFSTTISIYLSIQSSTPNFDNFVSLYRSFILNPHKNIPNKLSIKICKKFMMKSNKYQNLAPLFMAASFLLENPVEFEYVHIYSQLRNKGKIRNIRELIDYSNVLYSFLISHDTFNRFLLNERNSNSSIDNFKFLFENTIGDVLTELEKAELYGPHSSILYLTCLYLNLFEFNKMNSLPHHWHFLPIDLIKRDSFTDRKHSGQFSPENFNFIFNTVHKHLLSGIVGYIPLYHNEMVKTESLLCEIANNTFTSYDVLLYFAHKLNQTMIYEFSNLTLHKKDLIYIYPFPNDQSIDQFCELFAVFAHVKQFELNMDLNNFKTKFPSTFWLKIIKYFPQINTMNNEISDELNQDDKNKS